MNTTFAKEALEKLHHDFVVTDNLSIICKRFNATTLIKEFGVTKTPSKTYKLIRNCNKNVLINSIVNEMKLNNIFQYLLQKT